MDFTRWCIERKPLSEKAKNLCRALVKDRRRPTWALSEDPSPTLFETKPFYDKIAVKNNADSYLRFLRPLQNRLHRIRNVCRRRRGRVLGPTARLFFSTSRVFSQLVAREEATYPFAIPRVLRYRGTLELAGPVDEGFDQRRARIM